LKAETDSMKIDLVRSSSDWYRECDV